MATEFRPNRKPPAEQPKKLKRPISRQRMARMDRDAIYNAIRDVYLLENQKCAICPTDATEVHHIASGTAGRSRSLLNPNAWLGLCRKCHECIPAYSIAEQIKLKQFDVKFNIERLRK
jgi:hypothetical protein